jgi:hypothetical protein
MNPCTMQFSQGPVTPNVFPNSVFWNNLTDPSPLICEIKLHAANVYKPRTYSTANTQSPSQKYVG